MPGRSRDKQGRRHSKEPAESPQQNLPTLASALQAQGRGGILPGAHSEAAAARDDCLAPLSSLQGAPPAPQEPRGGAGRRPVITPRLVPTQRGAGAGGLRTCLQTGCHLPDGGLGPVPQPLCRRFLRKPAAPQGLRGPVIRMPANCCQLFDPTSGDTCSSHY